MFESPEKPFFEPKELAIELPEKNLQELTDFIANMFESEYKTVTPIVQAGLDELEERFHSGVLSKDAYIEARMSLPQELQDFLPEKS